MALYLGSKKVSPTKTITKELPSMKAFFDAGGKCAYSTATSFEGAIQYNDTSNVTKMESMFSSCISLTSIPQLNTNKVKTMRNMFYNCSKLTTIPQLDVSNVVNMNDMFYNCSNLKTIHMINMKVNFDISSSTKFTREALVEIINNCYDVTTLNKTAKLTMGSTNLAKLTDEDKLIATNKGWTLA